MSVLCAHVVQNLCLDNKRAFVDSDNLDSGHVDAQHRCHPLGESGRAITSEELCCGPLKAHGAEDCIARDDVEVATGRDEELEIVNNSHVQVVTTLCSCRVDGLWSLGCDIPWLFFYDLAVNSDRVRASVRVGDLDQNALG